MTAFQLARSGAIAALAAAALSLAWIGAASAQNGDVSPRIAVPEPDGGGGVNGCYRIVQQLYGPYRMNFCLRWGNQNYYQVKGGGLNCRGGLDWYTTPNGRVEIDLYRSQCGAGQAWTGDSLSCRIVNWKPLPPLLKGQPRIAVPVPVPAYGTLNCTYRPAVGGYPPTQVTARRI